ncbi:MAG: 2-dehydropantoate 2-reductase [Pigmentiphaga sp.]|uniref:ketopantoate reductase family protein n=1 Tax=Pigmentiphaga sp. TaxID=1977564 RepID=UPI0029B4DAFA|nr:2-dehydropantoate 2-reductase [Pigmentiphaga sp.]MDX3907798.1 2-dehydropantoate 2-reductase [Pigmentiphaga sp.]
MKLCVFGAGAIGGLIAGRLAQAGQPVSVVARGPHLAAIQRDGLTVRWAGGAWNGRITATARAEELGVQDIVVIAVKTCSLAAALPGIAPLVGPDTAIVPAMNGVPWWFFSGSGAGRSQTRLDNLDPDGRIAAALPAHQVVGCVVYPTAHLAAPGIVQHTGRWEVYLGDPDRADSSRSRDLHARLCQAGFLSNLTDNIRLEIWRKLIGNAAFNPISALTRATLDKMLADAEVYTLLKTLMGETIAVGRALGLDTGETPDARLERGRPMGNIKFSMLQDLEQGRPMEHEALSGAVAAIGDQVGVPTLTMHSVHGLIRTLAVSLQTPGI